MTGIGSVIDVWRPSTYPSWFVDCAKARSGTDDHQQFVENTVLPKISEETLRAWHYCRLLEYEISDLKTNGIKLCSFDRFNCRLSLAVSSGVLTIAEAAKISSRTPLNNSSHHAGRLGKFWMTSTPVPTEDPGVVLLLNHWGGEMVYFGLDDRTPEDQPLVEKLRLTGSGCIVEVAVPIAQTNHKFRLANALATNYWHQGKTQESQRFDLYIQTELGPEHILNIYNLDECNFRPSDLAGYVQ
ncbi:hypothetical protein [Vannielia sp. SX4]|uniref:hypothetical protein n=1 Tax=Vannielia sp. SX4 TaxID=3463852 RepID=UPI00405A1009